MNKRNFFKLVGGILGSTVFPTNAAPQKIKPFADLYNKFFPTMEGAWRALVTAQIDKEMIIRMIEIVYTDAQYKHLVDDIKHTSIEELKNLNFEIKPYKTGYLIIANDGPPRLKIHSFSP